MIQRGTYARERDGGCLLYHSPTRWNDATEVSIDQNTCVVSEVVSKTELRCTTPAGTPGSKPIRVSTSVDVDVLDAFVYSNGGLYNQQWTYWERV